jgi:signal transduction histidine kinase
MLALYLTAYAALGVIQARQRRLVPDFQRLERETGRLALEENLRARLTATMHDTLLNDLSFVMNAPDQLDPRAVQKLRTDVAKLTSSDWVSTAGDVAELDDQDSELRNRIMLLISDLQWRGLTVRVTGSGPGIYRLAPDVAEALIEAVRACLENVLRHAGTSVAELDLAYDDEQITVAITDQGVGFDPASVPADRLGLRGSIEARIQAVGGRVRIWSTPGTGTSVVLSVPVLERVADRTGGEHGVG